MIDLKDTYGKRYKVRLDDSYAVETWPRKTQEIAWYYEIVCKYGQIYNHSDTHLQMWITPRLGKRVYDTLPADWKVIQNADDGYAFSFPSGDIGRAFQYVKPRRKRIGPSNPAHLSKWQFPKKSNGA